MNRLLKWVGDVFPSSAYMEQGTPPNQINRRQGEIHLKKQIPMIDVDADIVRNDLVEKTIQLVRLKKQISMPRNTTDLQVEMISIINKVTVRGEIYMERVWWLQIGHPYVPFIESVIASRSDSRWEKLGTVGSTRLGIAFVYTDETIACMLRELVLMFQSQHYEIENHLPEEEEDEDYEEEEQERVEEHEMQPLNSIVLDVGTDGTVTEKKPTANGSYSVFGGSSEGGKKAD